MLGCTNTKKKKEKKSGEPSKRYANLIEENDKFSTIVMEANLVGDSWDWVLDTGATHHVVVTGGCLPPTKKWGMESM